MTKEKRLLPIVSCTIDSDGLLKLDKGAAMYMIQGGSIPYYQLHLKIERVCADENGRFYRTLPLWMVPFHWMRGLFRHLPGGGKWLWDRYPKEFETEIIDNYIRSFQVEYEPEK